MSTIGSFREDFEGHITVEFLVARAVHLSHPTCT
jgi:hypothetical protein